MLQPPFYLCTNGAVCITNSGALPQVAVDAVFAYLWGFIVPNFIIPFTGVSTLFFFVYVVTPAIGVLMMALLLTPKQFIRLFGFD